WCIGERASGRGDRATPVLERHAAQLASCGVPVVHARSPHPRWLAAPLPGSLEDPLRSRFAVLLPGASARHPGKRWPGYAELASLLQARGLRVFSVPGPDEMAALEAMPGEPLLDDGRPLSIPQLASVLLRADCVFGNDSGPTHLASHLGCRGVAVFGPGPSPAQVGLVRPRFAAIVGDPLASLPAQRVLDALP
ncbi:MAG TPA: glycosyltransferase family 9 protein, partial [Luteimonas sp.]